MKIFLSYAREDKATASELASQLRARGFNVWWDASIAGGDRFRETIQSELNAAEKVVVLWSKNSVTSDFVIDEASHALSLGKLVPVCIDGSQPPLGFRTVHTIDAGQFGPEVDTIADAVRQGSKVTRDGNAAGAPTDHSNFPLLAGAADFGNATASVEKYGIAYLHWLLMMIFRPMSLAPIIENMRGTNERLKFVIVIIATSVLLGSTLGSTIPDRPPLSGRLQILIVVSFVWLFWAVLIHMFCRLFGGKGDAVTAILVTLHTLAFSYLVSNVLTFIVWNLRNYYPPLMQALDKIGLESPGTMLILVQAALLLPLIPLTLGRAHVFSSAIELAPQFRTLG